MEEGRLGEWEFKQDLLGCPFVIFVGFCGRNFYLPMQQHSPFFLKKSYLTQDGQMPR